MTHASHTNGFVIPWSMFTRMPEYRSLWRRKEGREPSCSKSSYIQTSASLQLKHVTLLHTWFMAVLYFWLKFWKLHWFPFRNVTVANKEFAHKTQQKKGLVVRKVFTCLPGNVYISNSIWRDFVSLLTMCWFCPPRSLLVYQISFKGN